MAHRRPAGRHARRVLDEVPDPRGSACRRDRTTSAPPGSRSAVSRPGALAPPTLTDRIRTVPMATTSDFPWPDFDRWQAAFAAAGFFPPRWEGLERAPLAHAPNAEAYWLRKSLLFEEWLEMLAQRPVLRAHYARRGIRTRVERQDRRPSCPACDQYNGREVGRDLAAMPPFHPGCRCVLVAMHPGPSGRRARVSRTPAPAWGERGRARSRSASMPR